MRKQIVFGVLMAALALAEVAMAEEKRTERVQLVDGIKLYPTTTTDFGGVMKSESFQGAGGVGGGDSDGAAAGASGSATSGNSDSR